LANRHREGNQQLAGDLDQKKHAAVGIGDVQFTVLVQEYC